MKRCSQCRMSREGKFLLNGENPHSDSAHSFRVSISRQDECRFREVHLAGDRLHLLIAEPIGVRKNRQRIPLKCFRRKHIELYERIFTKLFGHDVSFYLMNCIAMPQARKERLAWRCWEPVPSVVKDCLLKPSKTRAVV